jgi:16S rRNA (uracil1498-N3)-methyltransferase
VNPRFYAPGAAQTDDVVALPPEEAQHLTRVLRLKAGASIRVFNGHGTEFDAVVERAGKEPVLVRLGQTREAVREAQVAVTLAQAVLKRDRMDDVVRDAVMIGVTAIQPVVTARSEITLQSLTRGRRRERWLGIAVSSVKQCGRAVVPDILEPQSFETVVASLTRLTLPQPCLMFVEPSAGSAAIPLGELDGTAPRETTILIGPEGGWTVEEIQRGATVSRQVTLGARTLRADAVPVVALAALFTRWGEF